MPASVSVSLPLLLVEQNPPKILLENVCFHFLGQNKVTWLPLAAKEAGKRLASQWGPPRHTLPLTKALHPSTLWSAMFILMLLNLSSASPLWQKPEEVSPLCLGKSWTLYAVNMLRAELNIVLKCALPSMFSVPENAPQFCHLHKQKTRCHLWALVYPCCERWSHFLSVHTLPGLNSMSVLLARWLCSSSQ